MRQLTMLQTHLQPAGQPPKTIAFLTANLTSKLSRDTWAGVRSTVHASGNRCICLSGGLLIQDNVELNQRNATNVYGIVSHHNIHGLVVYGGDIGQYVSVEKIAEFCRQYTGLPVVNIALEIPGIPNVIADNYAGMFDLTEHMIIYHGYRNIAFVKGPDGHVEADKRYQAFCDAMRKNGLELDPTAILPGDFNVACGIEAVQKLLDERKKRVEAIIAADDDTAVGIFQELRKRNIDVPGEVALGGFDDSILANVLEVPLTTVKQVPFNQGKEAARLLMEMMSGNEAPPVTTIKAEVVLRNSCGCVDSVFRKSEVAPDTTRLLPSAATFMEHRAELIDALDNLCQEENYAIDRVWLEALADGLFSSLAVKSSFAFNRAFQKIVHQISDTGGFISGAQEFISIIRRSGLKYLPPSEVLCFENLLHTGRIIVGHIAERAKSYSHYGAVEKLEVWSEINYRLNTFFDIECVSSVFEMVAESNFDKLGIMSFYLSLFADPENPLNQSRMVFAWEDYQVCTSVPQEGIAFETEAFLPAPFLDRLDKKTFVVCSISAKNEPFGFVLIETDIGNSQICEMLSWQISSAFKKARLIQEEKIRARELQASLDKLTSAQEQLVEAEKMASLGNLVAGVAHEINTPIGLGVTYASYLQEITGALGAAFNTGSLKKSDLERFIEKSAESTEGILFNMNRAAELIRSFKNVAVDRTNIEKRSYNVKEYVHEILMSLHSKLKKTRHKVRVICEDDLQIESYPGIFSQILTNLIMNSLIHGFEGIDEGEICIDIAKKKGLLLFVFSDNGRGMNQEQKKHIFEPFYTTKRGSGGTGLGAHIVYNLVTQSLNGTIHCESEEGKGVRFTIVFPL